MKSFYLVAILGIALSVFSCKKSSTVKASAPAHGILLTKFEKGNGDIYTYTYDDQNKLTGFSYIANQCSKCGYVSNVTKYDSEGRIAEVVTAYYYQNVKKVFNYDAKGNIVKMENFTLSGDSEIHASDVINVYDYDSMKLSSSTKNISTGQSFLQYEVWYDASKNISIKKIYGGNGQLSLLYVFHKFDTLKNPFSLIPPATFEYFDNSAINNQTLLTVTDYQQNPILTQDMTLKYEYNEDGYPTKETYSTATFTSINYYTYFKR